MSVTDQRTLAYCVKKAAGAGAAAAQERQVAKAAYDDSKTAGAAR